MRGAGTVRRGPRQRSSHAGLMHDASRDRTPSSPSRVARLDAIVVPTARPASSLQHAIRLSADLGVPLLALCSRQAHAEQVVARIRAAGSRGLAVGVPKGYVIEQAPTHTAAAAFRTASFGRRTDLSVKRNLGLLVARMRGWRKVLFLDDDIVGVRTDDIERLERQLDHHPVAGMVCDDFPDNSVVCHARRQVGLYQGNFVSGAALGVNCADNPLCFFPDVYNEDWFFFASAAADRTLPMVGRARQAEYDPFADPVRARHEEFGDLLAEGLYALFEEQPDRTLEQHVDAADEAYWARFIESRKDTIDSTVALLHAKLEAEVVRALAVHAAVTSLGEARAQLALILPAQCADFLHAWLGDLREWGSSTAGVNTVPSDSVISGELALPDWHSIGMEPPRPGTGQLLASGATPIYRRRRSSTRPEPSSCLTSPVLSKPSRS